MISTVVSGIILNFLINLKLTLSQDFCTLIT